MALRERHSGSTRRSLVLMPAINEHVQPSLSRPPRLQDPTHPTHNHSMLFVAVDIVPLAFLEWDACWPRPN